MLDRVVTPDEFKKYLQSNKPFASIKRLVLHHTETLIRNYKGNATIKSIWRYHTQVRGWSDIGYHILISPVGEIWLGRPISKQGAHCHNYNGDSIGVACIGNFMIDTMPERQYAALLEVVSRLMAQYNIAPSMVFPHKALNNTSCPGKKFPSVGVLATKASGQQSPGAGPAPPKWELEINGQTLQLMLRYGHTYAPVRALLDAIGCRFTVNNHEHKITVHGKPHG